jgi:hypothetical protein
LVGAQHLPHSRKTMNNHMKTEDVVHATVAVSGRSVANFARRLRLGCEVAAAGTVTAVHFAIRHLRARTVVRMTGWWAILR